MFLEVKSKDEEGIGHKFRLVATSQAIINLMTDGKVDHQIHDPDLVQGDSEIAQTLWSSIGTTDVHLLRSLVSQRKNPFRVILIRRFA